MLLLPIMVVAVLTALLISLLVAAINCTREGADPPTRDELAAARR